MRPLLQDREPRQQSTSRNQQDHQNPQRHYLMRQRFREFFASLHPALRSNKSGPGKLKHFANLFESPFHIALAGPGYRFNPSRLKVQIVT